MSKQHRNKQKCVKLQQSPVYPSSYSELCKYTALNVLKHFEQSPNRNDNDDFPEVNVNADEDSKFLVVEDLAAANLKADNSNNNSNNSGAKKNKKKSPPKKPKNTANKAPPSTRDCFGLEENSKSKLIAPVMPILKNSCNAPPGKRQSTSIRDVAGCGTMDARAYARLKSCCGAGATATKNQQLPSALRGCCGPDFVTGLGHVEDDSNKRSKRQCRPKCTSSTLHAPTISSKAKQPEKHPRNVFAALLDELETMKENKTKRDGGGGGAAACVKTKEPNPISYSSLLTSKAKPCGTKRPAKKNAGGTVSTQTPPVSPASTLNPSTASESKPPPKPVRKKKKTETPASPGVTPQTKAVAVPKKDQKLAENPSGPCANSQFRITINELHCEISSDTENTVNPAISTEKSCPSREDCCSVVTDSFIQQLKSEILNTKSSHLTCESTYVEVKQQEKYVEKLKDEISVNKAHCLEESRNRLNQLKCEIAKYRMYGKTQGCLNCMYAPKEMGACSMCAIRNDPIQEEEQTDEVPESSALAAVPG